MKIILANPALKQQPNHQQNANGLDERQIGFDIGLANDGLAQQTISTTNEELQAQTTDIYNNNNNTDFRPIPSSSSSLKQVVRYYLLSNCVTIFYFKTCFNFFFFFLQIKNKGEFNF